MTQSPTFNSVEQAINKCRQILDFEYDWDGDGAKPIKIETWERAVKYLRENAELLKQILTVTTSRPELLACSDGTVDLYWSTDKAFFLANVPESGPLDIYIEQR